MKVGEYNCAAKAFWPMTLAIPSKDTIVALHQLHPLPINLVPSPIFYYQHEHTFVLDRIVFAQALTIALHLSLGGLFGMVCEHFSRCFIPKNPSSRFSDLFYTTIVIACGDIPRSMALVIRLRDCWQWQRTLVVFVLLL
jgi:hypothetical protein